MVIYRSPVQSIYPHIPTELRDEQKRMEEDFGVLTPRTTALSKLDRRTVQEWCNDPLHEHSIPLPKVALHTASLIELQFERITATLEEISKNLRKFANKGDDPTPIIIADQQCQHMVRHLVSNLRVHLDPSSMIGQFLDSSKASKSTSKGVKGVVDFEEEQHMAAVSPNSMVIYMLTPSTQNIDLLLRDFKRPLGPGIKVALSFTSNCAPELLDKLTRCKYLRARLVQAPMVMYNNFLSVSQESISLGLPHAFPVMYSPMDAIGGRHKLTDACVEKMVSVCATLNDYPQIRFAVTGMNCGMVAAKFSDAFEKFLKRNGSFEFHGMTDLDNRSNMLILERNIDLCQPLMHGTCLQAFVKDYLPMESRVPIPMCMSEADSVWSRFRHCRVWDVKASIEAEFKEKKRSREDPEFKSLAGESGMGAWF